MATRCTYLYRLDVTYPERSLTDPLWEPPEWGAYCDEMGWRGDWGGLPPFRWPVERQYLSLTPAKRRKALLERLGAKAEVIRSLPVQWPTGESAE